MQVEKYLEKTQPVIYKTFKRALENKQLSHAYLLVGNRGTPLLQVSTFLARSILCDNPTPFACDNCTTCLRIKDENYLDFLLFNGENATISKNDIATIETQFQKAAIERKGIKVYVLNCIEYMSEEAINSILKFLEEPQDNVYAFLSTNNENAILPTIISRCQVMHLKSVNRNSVIEEAISLGVDKKDAELLSYFYNNGELIKDIIDDSENHAQYSNCVKACDALLESLNKGDKEDTIFVAESIISPLVNKRETFRFFLDVVITIFEDLLNIQNNRKITITSYDTILCELANNKLKHLNDTFVELLKQRNLINLNLNIPLQLDHIINFILKE